MTTAPLRASFDCLNLFILIVDANTKRVPGVLFHRHPFGDPVQTRRGQQLIRPDEAREDDRAETRAPRQMGQRKLLFTVQAMSEKFSVCSRMRMTSSSGSRSRACGGFWLSTNTRSPGRNSASATT